MPTYAEILEIATDVVSIHVQPSRRVRPNEHFSDDLGLDSLGVLEIVADLEERLGITIPMKLLFELHTIDEVARALPELAS